MNILDQLTDGIIPVHMVDSSGNTATLGDNATKTEEVEAAHYTCSTFSLPQGEIIGTGTAAIEPTQVLQLDPMRKRAVLTFNGDGQVILAHSLQQATSLAQNVQQAADEGALCTSPGSITVEATGPLWAVGVVTAATQGTIAAQGSAAAPAAAQNISGTIAAANIPAGTYTVTVATYIDGTVVTTTDDDNIKINQSNGGIQTHLLVPAGAGISTISMVVPFSGNQSIQIAAIAAGSASSVYHASVTLTPFPALGDASDLAVGVVQERRNS